MSQSGLKTFGIIWTGQLISLLGSGLTTFALGIWALERTGSVTRYALIIVLAGLPSILLGPFAGALVDRWDRRLVMLWTDLGPGLITLTYAFLLWRGELQVWHIYIGAFLNAVFSTFQWPAYAASITMLVEPRNFGRANGMMDFGEAGTTIAAPALAGLLLSVMDIWGVLLLDFASFLFAAVTLLLVRIPRPAPSAPDEGEAESSLWKDAAYGWHFIRARPGLLQLLFFFATVNLAVCTAGVALLPMVLGFTGSKAAVGTVMSLVGVGMLAGGAIMTATGGPRPRIYGVLGCGLLLSVCFVLVGIKPSLVLVGTGVILWYVGLPIMNGSSSAIWQSKVPANVQGRVFAMRRMLAQFTTPIGDFAAGPLADKIFLPLLLPGGALAGGAVGQVVGVGPGRGIGLMFLALAAVPGLAALWGFLNPRIRNLETEIPDAPVNKAEPAPAEGAEGEPATA